MLTVGQVAKAGGISTSALRYYESWNCCRRRIVLVVKGDGESLQMASQDFMPRYLQG